MAGGRHITEVDATAAIGAAVDDHKAGAGQHTVAGTVGLQATLDGKQPLDSDLTAIAALATTTPFGRARLADPDAPAARTALGVPTDPAAGTAGLRTLGTGAQQAAPGPAGITDVSTRTEAELLAWGDAAYRSIRNFPSLLAAARELSGSADPANPTRHVVAIDGNPMLVEVIALAGDQTINANANWGSNTPDTAVVLVRVDGHLTINAGVKVTTPVRKLGLFVLVMGTATVAGELSMTRRGARHDGGGTSGHSRLFPTRDLVLINGVADGLVPARGAAGAVGVDNAAGNTGAAGVAGQTGGGGSGGSSVAGGTTTSQTGSGGTGFGGGAGGGGTVFGVPTPGGRHGGPGGIGGASGASTTRAAGGGAGNPGGSGAAVGTGVGDPGQAGTGGILALVAMHNRLGNSSAWRAGNLAGSGLLTADGADGGSATSPAHGAAGGGGSGGGSVSVYYAGGAAGWTGTLRANGGAGGTATAATVATNGGAGGAGSTRLIAVAGLHNN